VAQAGRGEGDGVRWPEALAADFCCGAGGLSEGLARSGWTVAYACDTDPAAVLAYRRNLAAGRHCCLRDLRDLSSLEWDDLGRRCILWAAGLPCQPFSPLGKRLGTADPRDLWPTFRAGIESGRPDWVLLENVPDIRRWHDPAEDLRRLGYRAWEAVLRACDFGVPQLRRRWFCVATRMGGDFRWPEPTHSGDPWQAALGAPRTPAPCEVTTVPLRRLVTVVASEGRGQSAPRLRRRHAGMPRIADHIGRNVSPPEAAALQCLPAGWTWPTARSTALRLIGNAVPPPVAEALGRAILWALRGGASA
jgi:DNA (cytosine-5)-methyltransferase 1